MAPRVTIQDIADALGISRNTVSKAINNTGVLADATREKVLKKAKEMGYKQFSYETFTDNNKPSLSISTPKERNEIALLTTIFLSNSHFSSTLLDKFQRELSRLGYSLTMHRILPEELDRLVLPSSFIKERIAGIVCIELFDHEYAKSICDLGMPVLFIDSPIPVPDEPLEADKLYMDNCSNIFLFVKEMVRRGKTKIGFIGEYLHCYSFFERYMGYRDSMYLMGLPCPDEYCIIKNKEGIRNPSPSDYQEYLTECIQKLEQLPDVFICANDFVALDTMHVLKKLGYSVPGDVYLCGFDDSPESKVATPSLTTIHIHSQIMGFSAVHLLMSRINEPSLNYRTVHTETSLIYRESTEY
ncbi:MAG: LacI family DNA-binding transcriptional regulator [Eubacterium sp.]|nr:LacI family DNA-binding transcriptional regulator [Eubacterium sp.]